MPNQILRDGEVCGIELRVKPGLGKLALPIFAATHGDGEGFGLATAGGFRHDQRRPRKGLTCFLQGLCSVRSCASMLYLVLAQSLYRLGFSMWLLSPNILW